MYVVDDPNRYNIPYLALILITVAQFKPWYPPIFYLQLICSFREYYALLGLDDKNDTKKIVPHFNLQHFTVYICLTKQKLRVQDHHFPNPIYRTLSEDQSHLAVKPSRNSPKDSNGGQCDISTSVLTSADTKCIGARSSK